MRSLFSSFIPVSMVLANLVNAGVIAENTQLGGNILTPTVVDNGSAGIAIDNTNDISLVLTLNRGGTTIDGFLANSSEAYGIYAKGTIQIDGSVGKKLIFNSVGSTNLSVYGIKASDITLDGISLTFKSLSSTASFASNSDIQGINSQLGEGLNLVLRNNASIHFESIKSNSNFAYLSGIATGFGGTSSNIDLSAGSICFDEIVGVENTVGLVFQATNNSLSGDIVFSHIESTGDLIFNGNPISRNAYGISFAPSASAILKENSRIYITSMASKGSIYPLFAQQSLSLTFERNAGLIYGAITEDEKVNSYGIYAKTDKTLNYYFGAGDSAGSAPVGAKGTIFQSIQSAGNTNAYGMYLQTTAQANFNLNGKATFENIQADSGDAYGIYTMEDMSLQGVGGGEKKISFVNIVSQSGQAVGLQIGGDLTLGLGGDLIFDGIETNGGNNAYGISFAPSASAILKENSRIYITSMASKGSIYPLFAQQSLSLTFERNAGLIYGAITEDEKVNSYGIYAKTDKTLNYYFGAGDSAGSAPVGAKGTIFQSIQSAGNTNAYGMYLQTTAQANFNLNGKATFENIQADSGDAYGIYVKNSEIVLGEEEGTQLLFETMAGSTRYAIKNQGKIYINQGSSISFGTSTATDYVISNTLENLVYELGETEVGDGSVAVAVQYGFYNTATQTKLNGSLSVKNFTGSSPFSLIYYGGALAGAMEIDSLSISAYGDQTGSSLLGFNASQDLQLILKNTLNITLMDETSSTQYEAINTPRSEGVAFGEKISLKLGENAKVIFNANGGNLESLSNLDDQSGGIISLAGEIKEAQEPTNRIWKDGGNARSFNARHLEIQNLQTQQTQFVLYADKGAKVANYANALYGKAYIDGAKVSTDRTDFGGSDSITISGTTSQGGQPLSNNLVIELGGLSGDNKDISQNVVLAIVDSKVKDNVIFNGLTKSGDSVLVKTYSGFDTLDLEIKRFDDMVSGNSFYYSNLVAYNPKVNTDYLAPIFNSLNVNFLALSGNFNSLSKRLGDLKNEVNSNGVWARVFGGKQTMDFGIKTDQTYITTQMGYDYALDCTDAKNFIGIALSYNYASSTQDQTLYTQWGTSYANSAKTQGVEVALYNTYQSNDGLYSDSIAKVGYFVSDLDLYKANLSNYSNLAFTLSEEVGYEFDLGESKEWMITPQGELAYAFMNGKDVSIGEFTSTLNLASQDLHLLRMRAGVNWGYRFNNTSGLDKIKALLYLGTYYEYDAIFGGDVTFSNSIAGSATYNGMSSNGRFVLNLGVDMQIFEETKLYLDVEKSFGNKMSKEYQVNFGVRYSFGDKIEIRPKEEEPKELLPLSVPQETQNNQQESQNKQGE